MSLSALTRSSRPRPVAFVVSLLLVWLLLAVLAVAVRRGPIEKDLARRATEAVRRSGGTHAVVTVAGTSVTLHGDFPSLAAAQAALRAARVDGVSSAELGADAHVTAPAAERPVAGGAGIDGGSTGGGGQEAGGAGGGASSGGTGAGAGQTGAGGAGAGELGAGGAGGDGTAVAALAAATGGRPVTFAPNSVLLSASDRAVLDGVAAALASGTLSVVIAGHADSAGPAAYNEALSVRRAEAARAYLVGEGVPAARLRAVGLGERQPVADNAAPAGRAANRRVEITPDPSS